MRRLPISLWPVLCLAMLPGAALAQTPTVMEGDQFLVNTVTTGFQTSAAVAMSPDGTFVIVWQNASPDDVFAQRFGSNGQPAASQFLVNTYTTGVQYLPDVAMDDGGNFVVVWDSSADDVDTSGRSIQAQRFQFNGAPLTGQILVNGYTTGDQRFPSVATDAEGDFVVVWTSDEADNGDSLGTSIQGRRFASSGSALGAQFLVNDYTTGSQFFPVVSVDGEGRFVVAWQSDGSGYNDFDSFSIQARRFSSSGLPLAPQFQPNSYTTGSQDVPSIAADSAGNFVVAWQSDSVDDDPLASIQGQHYDLGGDPLGQEFRINSYTTSVQLAPSVAVDASGDFVVTWHSLEADNGDSDGQSIQAQRFASNGDSVGGQFLVNAYTTSTQSASTVATDRNGDFVVAWESYGSDNGDPDGRSIQGQRFRVTADIGDFVFLDQNLDGLQTVGEPGEPEVTVHLFESGGGLLESTVTDENGAFLFRPKIALLGVADEFYLGFEAPGDLTFTAADVGEEDTIDSDAEPMSGETGDFTILSAGEDRTDVDAGLAAGIGNRVWQDLDGDGLQDEGEPGVDGVVVELYDGVGVLEDSTMTSGGGHYAFFGIESGTYYLGFTAPEGTVFTARGQGGDDTVDSDVNPATGTTSPFVFTSGELTTDWDAGLVDNVSQIGDRAWLDADANGVQDGGENGVEGVTVNLYREPDPPSPTETATLEATDVTDASGLYDFEVEPGTYYLELVCPAGTITLQDQGGDDALDSDVNPSTGTTSPFVLALGVPDDTRDGGLLDGDADGVATCVDNCPDDSNPIQVDSDGDGSGDPCDLCAGDDAGGDADGDGLCAGSPFECDDGDPTNACAVIFDDGFESGDTTAWSTTIN